MSAHAPRLSLDAFTAMLERVQLPLLTFLRGLLGNVDEARDVAQETFIAAWGEAQAGKAPFLHGVEPARMRRWIFHAAYNRAISVLRRRRVIHWEPLDAEASDVPRDFVTPAFENRVVEELALRAAFAELAPPDAACLILIIVQGFTAAEAAQIVDATPEAVAKRLARAKQRLRTIYLNHDTPPEGRD